jgi:hypothetical protein
MLNYANGVLLPNSAPPLKSGGGGCGCSGGSCTGSEPVNSDPHSINAQETADTESDTASDTAPDTQVGQGPYRGPFQRRPMRCPGKSRKVQVKLDCDTGLGRPYGAAMALCRGQMEQQALKKLPYCPKLCNIPYRGRCISLVRGLPVPDLSWCQFQWSRSQTRIRCNPRASQVHNHCKCIPT